MREVAAKPTGKSESEFVYIERYWQQCRAFDTRPFDTRSVMSSSVNQVQSQRAFREFLFQLNKRSDFD